MILFLKHVELKSLNSPFPQKGLKSEQKVFNSKSH